MKHRDPIEQREHEEKVMIIVYLIFGIVLSAFGYCVANWEKIKAFLLGMLDS